MKKILLFIISAIIISTTYADYLFLQKPQQGIQFSQESIKNSFVSNGLVINLDAADPNSYSGTGTTWNDLSGNNYNATIHGTFNFNDNGIDLGTTPNITNYISFSKNAIEGLSSWTYEFVINRHVENSLDSLVSAGPSNNSLIYLQGSNIGYQQGVVSSSTLNIGFNSNQKTHLIVTGSGNTVTYYVNGIYKSQETKTTNLSTNTSIGVILGQELDSSSGTFDSVQSFLGNYHSFRIYNRVLSEQEIIDNYNYSKSTHSF